MSVKNTMKKIGQRACLGDIISQTYPIVLALIISLVHNTLCCNWKQVFLK